MIYWGCRASVTPYDVCRLLWSIRDKMFDKTPRTQFHYFPFDLRLQQLYAFTITTSHMRWQTEHHLEDGEMCHPSDNET